MLYLLLVVTVQDFHSNGWVILIDILFFDINFSQNIQEFFLNISLISLLALWNGYTTTVVYLTINKDLKNESRTKIRRWVALFNQIGSLSGSYLCLLIVKLHLLGSNNTP